MRALVLVISAVAMCLPAAPLLAQAQQTSKYRLMVVAGGANDGGRSDGVAMGGTGVYPGRQECEAAGAGIRFGVVNPAADQPRPTITWICVPLGKP